jgi:hypothetical protein
MVFFFEKHRIGPRGQYNMRKRSEDILLGILFGFLGGWMCLAGLGIIRTGIHGMQGPGQVVAGLMFFFAGAWSFFQGSLGPDG